MENKLTTKSIDAQFVRSHFWDLTETAEKFKTQFLVSRIGKPKEVILRVDDYLRNLVKKSDILSEIRSYAVSSGLCKMSEQEIESEIEACRRSE